MMKPAGPGAIVHTQHAGEEDQREGHAEQRMRQQTELDQRRQREDRECLDRQQQPRAGA